MATALQNLSEQDTKGLSSKEKRIALVVSEWNKEITENLMKGANDCIMQLGDQSTVIDRYWIPGTFELSFASSQLSQTNHYDAIIAIGSVIRGETAHFDFVCSAAAQGVKEVNLNGNTPCIFCVLTDDTWEQAKARSGGRHGNKGVEAAVAALKMIRFKQDIARLNDN